MYFVYTLVDPRDNAVRYVGITNDVYARFSQHIRCEGNNITKNRWITELRELNQMVIMRTIETAETIEEVRKREAYWIQQYTSQGANLLNITGSKSFTFDQFMSFFQDGGSDDPDLVDEVSQVPDASPIPSQRIRKNGSKLTRNMYTISEASRIVRCSVREIKMALESGKLLKAKNSDKIIKSSLERYIAERKQQNK
jgi:predicted GIY-YIG superfamily endonuclease